MAKSSALTIRLHIEGANETLRAFRNLPKEASKELREASLKLSETLAASASAAARSDSPQSALLAPTVRPVRDRVPAVQAGGSKRVGRNKAPAWGVLFGAEFGMNQRSGWYAFSKYNGSDGQQYRPHQGRQGYWFFSSIEREETRISAEWRKAADDVMRAFTEGGG